MASSSAPNPDVYLAELEPARAAELSIVRDVVNEAVPEGYVETMDFGMITWVVPLETYPDTYNKRPLCYAGLAAQKRYSSLYLMTLYSASARMSEPEFRARWAGGRPLDMGKACVRFRSHTDLDLPLIAEVVGSVPVPDFVAAAESMRYR